MALRRSYSLTISSHNSAFLCHCIHDFTQLRWCSTVSNHSTGTGKRPLNRKRKEMLDRMIRVDHAGEYGATRIYAGQHAVLGKSSIGPKLQDMWDQEKVHLAKFEQLMPKHRARPTALLPIWNIAGFALGAGSALIGKEAAMACTVAVETAIGEHYNDQLRELMEDDAEEHEELLKVIKKFRDEELEHLDTGLEHGAEQAPFYKAMSKAIQFGCKGAIWLSERV